MFDFITHDVLGKEPFEIESANVLPIVNKLRPNNTLKNKFLVVCRNTTVTPLKNLEAA